MPAAARESNVLNTNPGDHKASSQVMESFKVRGASWKEEGGKQTVEESKARRL